MNLTFLKKYKFYISICVIVLLLFTKNNTISNNSNSNNNIDENINEELYVGDVENEENTLDTVVVDVKGAVMNPGVYELPIGSRVVDLIEKAGGMTHENTECVNLSHKISDEEVVVIPDEDAMCGTGESLTQSYSEDNQKININMANSDELQTLTGIGQTRAEDIISYREENGNFNNIEDLKNVNGIGESTYENLKEQITV